MCEELTAQTHSQAITRVSYMWQVCAVDQALQVKLSLLNLRGLTMNRIKNPARSDISSTAATLKNITVLHNCCHFFL